MCAARKAAWCGASSSATTPAESAAEWANAAVLACYRGEEGGDGIHLLGPLAKKVVRIAPPLVITEEEAQNVDGPDVPPARAAGGASDE